MQIREKGICRPVTGWISWSQRDNCVKNRQQRDPESRSLCADESGWSTQSTAWKTRMGEETDISALLMNSLLYRPPSPTPNCSWNLPVNVPCPHTKSFLSGPSFREPSDIREKHTSYSNQAVEHSFTNEWAFQGACE